MPQFGTPAWANETNGTMTLANKLTLLKQEVQRQIAAQLKRLTATPIRSVLPVDLDHIVIPDSALALTSLEYCESLAPASLFHHSLRTYYWGSILAQQDGLKLDPELFYIMSLLHDIGLCDAHNQQDGHSTCFAVEGGRAARNLLNEHGESEKAMLVEAAIIQHLNLFVGVNEGVERHLLPHATAFDVVGARTREVKSETIAAILEQYPRLSFKDDLTAMFNREYTNRPNSRIAFMHQIGNMNRRIKKAPFDS